MLKNMKIKNKLILSCIVIALVASISGIVSSIMMVNISQTYNKTLDNFGFAQGDVGKALAAFCRVDGNVHDAISYFDEADVKAATDNIPMWEQKFEDYMATVEVTNQSDEAKAIHQKVMDAWEKYKPAAADIVADGTRSDEAVVISAAQRRLVNELDPLYGEVYNGLADLMAIKVDMGNASQASTKALTTTCVTLAIVLVVVAIVLSLTFGTVLSSAIAKPMQACCKRLDLLSEGDLTTPVPDINSKDEIGELAVSTKSIVDCLNTVIGDIGYLLGEMADGDFNIRTKAEAAYRGELNKVLVSIRKINHNLSDTLSQITQSSDQVAAGADQVSTGAQSLAQGATEQASAVEELSATIADIANNAKKNAENSQKGMEHSQQAGAQVNESARYMEDMVQAMGKISESSEEISKITATIENIAFQTNILALNAAVEAARAGSAGKGFAVVADEVRNLASKSDQAAKATKELIEHSIESVREGTDIVKNVSDSMDKTAEIAGAVLEDIQLISAAAAEESEAIAQVTEGIDQISSVVQTNSATSEESAAASEELSSQAAIMKELLSRFNLRPIENSGFQSTARPGYQPSHEPASAAEPVFETYSAPAPNSFSKY